jgi:hypothetical protein
MHRMIYSSVMSAKLFQGRHDVVCIYVQMESSTNNPSRFLELGHTVLTWHMVGSLCFVQYLIPSRCEGLLVVCDLLRSTRTYCRTTRDFCAHSPPGTNHLFYGPGRFTSLHAGDAVPTFNGDFLCESHPSIFQKLAHPGDLLGPYTSALFPRYYSTWNFTQVWRTVYP